MGPTLNTRTWNALPNVLIDWKYWIVNAKKLTIFHLQVIPKNRGRLSQLQYAEKEDEALLGHLMFVAGHVAKQQGLSAGGYRVIVNDGKDAGQTVFHLHLHIMGGRLMKWPAGWRWFVYTLEVYYDLQEPSFRASK